MGRSRGHRGEVPREGGRKERRGKSSSFHNMVSKKEGGEKIGKDEDSQDSRKTNVDPQTGPVGEFTDS